MRKFIKGWWWRLIGLHWQNLLRSGLSTAGTEDPHEQSWREKHFRESMRANWKIFVGQWASLFDWCYSKHIQEERRIRRVFRALHHPMSGTRQLADWRRMGPNNPPPAVRGAIAAMRSPEMLGAHRKAVEILSHGD